MFGKRRFSFSFFIIFASINCNTADRGQSIGCYRQNLYLHRVEGFAGSSDSCIDDCEKLFFRFAVLDGRSCLCTNRIVDNEIAREECDFPCVENPKQICGGNYAQSYYDTGVQVAGPARQVEITNRTSSSISLRWQHFDPLVLQSGDTTLSQYIIRARVLKSYSSLIVPPPPQWTVEKRHNSKIELVNLHPGTKYNITITSESDAHGEGGVSSIIAETEIGIPDPEPPQPKVLKREGNTMTIEIPPLVNDNGPISAVHVVVIYIDSELSLTFDESLLKSFSEAQEDGVNYYIAAELSNEEKSRQFVIGDGRNYNGFVNAPLPSDLHAHVALGIISRNGEVTQKRYAVSTSHEQHDEHASRDPSSSASGDENSGLVTFLIVACCFIGILLVSSIVAYVYLRLRMEKRLQRLPSDHHELTLQGPIVEVENNGAYQPDEFTKRGFEQRLDELIEKTEGSRKFPRNALTLEVNKILATGQFGDVIRGKLNGELSQVHVISDDMEPLDKSDFLNDFSKILELQKHTSILNFHGICQTADWLYLLFEDAPIILKKALVESRTPPNVNPTRFSTFSEQRILEIILEIGKALEFLAQNQFIHRRVCSYNVRLTSANVIKVSCFGATPSDSNGKAIDLSRWSAPEVLRFQHHSDRSMVWSFACVVWECCSLGGTLYADIKSADLMTRIKAGARADRIPFVYDDMSQLLMNCWQTEPSERPTFGDINQSLSHLLQSPQHILSFTRREGILLPYYLPLLEAQV